MKQQESTGIGWFVAGIGVGALLGVLFAPKAGRELRENLIDSARDSKDYVATRGKEAREQINSAVDRGREQVSDLVDRGRDQVNEYVERGKGVADGARDRWGKTVERAGEAIGNTDRG